MESMELYHIHKHGKYDSLWEKKKELIVTDNFKNLMCERYTNYSTAINLSDQIVNFHDYLTLLLYSINNGIKIPKEELEELIASSYDMSYYGNMFKRETALENYRRDNVSSLPSRLHSVYLTDEKGIDYWISTLQTDDYSLYRVEATGNIFKTNEQLMPIETLSYKDTYDSAYNYWHPNFRKVPDYTNEYLVQGKIKKLEKLSR